MSRETKTVARVATTATAGTNANDTEQAQFADVSLAQAAPVVTYAARHPALIRMFDSIERLYETDPATALPLLGALATLNGSRAFRQAIDAEVVP